MLKIGLNGRFGIINILIYVMLLCLLIIIPVSSQATWLTSLETGKSIELYLQENQVIKGTIVVWDEEQITLDVITGEVKIAINKIKDVRFPNSLSGPSPTATTIPMVVLPAKMSSQTRDEGAEKLLKNLKLDKFLLKSNTKEPHLILGTITNSSDHALDQLAADIVFYDALGATLTSQKRILVSKNKKYLKYSLPPKGTRRVRLTQKYIPPHTTAVSLQLKSLQIYDGDDDDVQTITGIYGDPVHHKFKIAAGFGTPYGLLGINTEIAIADFIGFHGGIGTLSPLDISGIGFILGLRLYAIPPDNVVRIRLGLGYGTGAAILLYRNNYKIINAIQPSIGIEFKLWEPVSLNIDAIYLLLDQHEFNNGYISLILEDEIKLAIGITFHLKIKKRKVSHQEHLSNILAHEEE